MNPKTINRNLYTSGALCTGCLVLAGVCLLLHLPDYAAVLGFLALVQGTLFIIWYARKRKPGRPARSRKPQQEA